MSDTPRTEAFLLALPSKRDQDSWYAFGQQLEREFNAAIADSVQWQRRFEWLRDNALMDPACWDEDDEKFMKRVDAALAAEDRWQRKRREK
jgi:hypothetical protein